MKKYALITGASGGIGLAIAKNLASDGFSLYLHYNKNKQSVYKLKNELDKINTETYLVHADLSSRSGVDELLKQISHPIESIVYNCGISYVGLITDMSNEEVENMITLSTTSLFLLTQSLLPQMVSMRCGNITVITSIWGNVGAACEVLYSMVKGGQNTFVKALAKEVAPSGIRVNAIAPGAIDTEMLKCFTDEDLKLIKEDIPMGRLGTPEEIANVISFLQSDKASYITGQILTVSGGWY